VIQLIVDNSYSRVLGLNTSQFKHLRDELSYTTGSFFSRFGPTRKSMLNKRGEFPSGLLCKVEAYLGKFGYAKKDLRRHPDTKKLLILDPDAYEAQSEAVRQAYRRGQGTISMPTGSGKSRVIKMIAHCLNAKTLVIVPSLEIKRQLSETLKDNKNVIVENIDSKALKTLTGFDCLIIDEAHHVAAKTYQKLNKTAWKSIYYRFLLTATPFRNNNEEQLLFEGIAGQVIYRLSYAEAVEKKYIVPVEAYVIETPKQKTNASTYAQVYSQLVVNNTPRNCQIAALLTALHSAQKSTLCLVKEVRHGKILAELTGVPFCSGEDEDSRRFIRRFNDGTIKILIATEGMLGEGIDTKPCEYVILAGLGKAKSALMQKIGRTVRTYPGKESGKVILFRDKSHRFTLRHYNAQCKVLLEEYGIKPSKLEDV
jgi:superfamily II DNA or RNA helicase